MSGEPDDEYWGGDGDECPTCEGNGWGIVGDHFPCLDGVNGPYNGDVANCPNCGGTGRRRDCMTDA